MAEDLGQSKDGTIESGVGDVAKEMVSTIAAPGLRFR